MKPPPETPSKNPGLQLYHQVLGLDDMHYGVWNGEELTLDNLKAAQRRYTDELLDWVADDVRTILDVGCGYGSIGAAMKARGWEVTGLTPDSEQLRAFRDLTEYPCIQARFQDLVPEQHFDLILMSQSCHHIPLDALFQVAAAAAPGGYLLVADYFILVRDGTRITRLGHMVDGFLEAAEKHDFALIRDADITDEVLPTLDLARDMVDNRLIPALQIARQSALRKHPIVTRSLLWFLRRKITKLNERRRYVDREDFLRFKRYKRYLFRVPRDDRGPLRSGNGADRHDDEGKP